MPPPCQHAAPARDAFDCLALLAAFHGLTADAAALRARFAPIAGPVDAAALRRAARTLGLRARPIRADWARLARLPLPLLARGRDGDWRVVAGARADAVLVQDGADGVVVGRDEFAAGWTGEILLLERRETRSGAARRGGFGWFTAALLRRRGALVEVLVATLLLQLLGLAAPIGFQVVVDKVLVHHGLATLDVLCAGLVLVALFEALLATLRTALLADLARRVDLGLGGSLFDHMLRLPLAWFAARRVGETVARVRELEQVREFLTGAALALAIDLPFVAACGGLLWLYEPGLAGLVFASLPCYALLAALSTPRLRSLLEDRFARAAAVQSFLVEALGAAETLKAAAVEPRFSRRWRTLLAADGEADARALRWSTAAAQAAALMQKLVTVLVLWVGARRVIEGGLSVGELVAFNMLAARVSGPVLRLVQLWQEFQQAALAVRRLDDVLAAPAERPLVPRRTSLPALVGRIRFERVSLRYLPERPEALSEVSFEIAPGRFVGVVGASGSGKSSVARLLLGLYPPTAGRVLVDGQDLAGVDPVWLRRHVGVVLQDDHLFDGSVRENIVLRDPALPFSRVVEAARLAGAHGFILDLPAGYDTHIGEHGAALSGGQRQRIALARALAGDPRILLLDEATSALDYESEALIRASLPRIAAGRTVIQIAHRLATVRDADAILVFERGLLVECGNHDHLLARGGVYARLLRRQPAG